MTKHKKLIPGLLALLLVLALGAELTLGVFACNRLKASAEVLETLQKDNTDLRTELSGLRGELGAVNTGVEALQKLAAAPEDPAQEDDVTIASEYHIRSTLPLSDAYRSGDRSGLSDKQKETLDMASAVLEEIITEDMDAYEKEQAVYVWMTENLAQDEGLLPVIPRTQADCDNPYGVLKYHNAVCVGYATTFRLFMQMLDIPCKVVHNSECYHSWDLVQLDGGWYHTDIYSDAGRASFAHFNRTDAMQATEQSWNTDFFPASDRYDYCYAVRASVEEKDLYHVPAALREAIDAKANILSLRFDESLDEVGAQIVQNMLEQIQNRIDNSELSSRLYVNWSWLPLDTGWLLAIDLTWYNSGEHNYEIPDEAYEKIDKAVEDAFGDLEFVEDPYWGEPVG